MGEAVEDFLLAVLVDQLGEAPLAEAIGAELAADVAQHQLGRAAVRRDDALEIAVGHVAAPVAHGGKLQALVEHLARLARAAAGHRSADVALVSDAAAEAELL